MGRQGRQGRQGRKIATLSPLSPLSSSHAQCPIPLKSGNRKYRETNFTGSFDC